MSPEQWADRLVQIRREGPWSRAYVADHWIAGYRTPEGAEAHACFVRSFLIPAIATVLSEECSPRLRGQDLTPERLLEMRRKRGQHLLLNGGDQDALLDYIDLLHSLLQHDSEAYNQGLRDGRMEMADPEAAVRDVSARPTGEDESTRP